ncbi:MULTISPECIES: hypothetical protein [unclassified Bradyrhizobium]
MLRVEPPVCSSRQRQSWSRRSWQELATPRFPRFFAGSQFGKTATVIAVSCLIGALFAGSTVATPLYVIYKQQLGFSQITLTLIYAVYVVGNLTALMIFGRMSDQVGRRRCRAAPRCCGRSA